MTHPWNKFFVLSFSHLLWSLFFTFTFLVDIWLQVVNRICKSLWILTTFLLKKSCFEIKSLVLISSPRPQHVQQQLHPSSSNHPHCSPQLPHQKGAAWSVPVWCSGAEQWEALQVPPAYSQRVLNPLQPFLSCGLCQALPRGSWHSSSSHHHWSSRLWLASFSHRWSLWIQVRQSREYEAPHGWHEILSWRLDSSKKLLSSCSRLNCLYQVLHLCVLAPASPEFQIPWWWWGSLLIWTRCALFVC